MGDEPKLVYYDKDGKRVPEGSVESVVQYLDDDPARPDSPQKKAERKAQTPAIAQTQAVTAPTEIKARLSADSTKALLVEEGDRLGVDTKAEILARIEAAPASDTSDTPDDADGGDGDDDTNQ